MTPCNVRWLRPFLVLALFGSLSSLAVEKLDHTDITRPEFFPIFPWNTYVPKVPYVKGDKPLDGVGECNFNMAPFVGIKELALCRKLGLGAIVVSDTNFVSFKTYRGRDVSDAEINEQVKRMVKATGSNPAVKGYFVIDEPGVKDFPVLAKAVAAFKKHAPGKLAYINLFPDYATIGATNKSQLGTSNYTEYLERFVKEVKPQMLSYDNYMVQMSQDLKDPTKFASYYRNLLEVRRVAQKYNLPYLQIVSANQIRSHTTIPSPANLAFQAYTTLAAGYRGVGWFTYYEGTFYNYAPINKQGRKSQTWHFLKEINRQVATLAPVMSRLRSTGVYFSESISNVELPNLPGKIVKSFESDAPIMIGEFEDPKGERYVMLVNLSLERSTKVTLPTDLFSKVQVVSSADASLSPIEQKAGLWLVAGQGVLLKVSR